MNSMIFDLSHLLEIMNGANGMSDIEGKVTRVGASERGQRMSFKTAVLFGAVALFVRPVSWQGAKRR
jgi:hypothetical protein